MDYFNVGTTYYFWDKRLNRLAEVRIDSKTSDMLFFHYHGKLYSCDIRKAVGKLFKSKSEAQQHIARMKAKKPKTIKRDYRNCKFYRNETCLLCDDPYNCSSYEDVVQPSDEIIKSWGGPKATY